ncbi:GntR family transcriptional regulator, partial [Bacillus thuringiensis]
SKIQRLEISQFTSINGRKSVEQHQQIIEACKNNDKETTAHLVEQNWLSLEKLMTYEAD